MDDGTLMPYITSANVACGMHAGDPTTMDQTVDLALSRGVRVGAHPGYPDRENFGRAAMEMSSDEIENLVVYQVAALEGFVRSRGARLTHVKPHGALYHRGAEFPDVARAIADGVRRVGTQLVLIGAAGSMLIGAGRDAGLPAAEEAVRLARDGVALAEDASTITVRADTICLHGDTPGAAEIAKKIHERFRTAGIRIAPLDVALLTR